MYVNIVIYEQFPAAIFTERNRAGWLLAAFITSYARENALLLLFHRADIIITAGRKKIKIKIYEQADGVNVSPRRVFFIFLIYSPGIYWPTRWIIVGGFFLFLFDFGNYKHLRFRHYPKS